MSGFTAWRPHHTDQALMNMAEALIPRLAILKPLILKGHNQPLKEERRIKKIHSPITQGMISFSGIKRHLH